MNQLRIGSNLYTAMQADLRRRHKFAAERVGFLFVRSANLPKNGALLLGIEYLPVEDGDYIDDVTVGARINGNAIRTAMQRILDSGQGCFHVHVHGHIGKPGFSGTDAREMKTLIPCFQRIGQSSYHGAIILSENSACGLALAPGKTAIDTHLRIVILHPPMRIV